MNVLGVILARAGSAGLKNKHLLPLLGRPVIKYTFAHARQSKLLSRVVVSTDSPQVRRLAEANFFETVKRPPELATAEASVQDAMLHAMDVVEQSSAFRADALVVLYGNVPVRGDGVIDRAIRTLADTGCDSVRSFCPVGKWHPAWMSKLTDDGVVEPLHPGSVHRRQDLPSLFLHDGAVVAVSRGAMLRGKDNPLNPHAFFGLQRRGIRTEPGETVEIDVQRDLYWAEALLREREQPAASGATGNVVSEQGNDSLRMAS
jgi:CMP-N,N'-diacetyllegionaminic acid synthase